MIPLWIWPLLAVALLWLIACHDERQAKRKIEAFRQVEAERRAREAARPLGNVDRWVS